MNTRELTVRKRHIYIISDLHLGGAPPELTSGDVGFQMCPPQSRRRLARFIHHISTAHPRKETEPGEETELIINGDFVDFLAEEDRETPRVFSAFAHDAQLAVDKFRRVVQRTDADAPAGERVFEALRAFVGQGHKLTMLLGNHDLELSIPAVRHVLMEILTQGRPARVEFLYDGEAYVQGDLLVEHGNRYDGWNAVAYGVLRAYRSMLSRNEPQQIQFVPPPGSRLVTEIMNPLKAYYKFIDLLKPENEALIPVLAALDSSCIPSLKEMVFLLRLAREKKALEPEPGEIPGQVDNVADSPSIIIGEAEVNDLSSVIYGDPVAPETLDRSFALLTQAEEDWAPESEIGEVTPIAEGQADWKQTARGCLAFIKQLAPFSPDIGAKLHKTLLCYRETIGATSDLKSELPIYLDAATRLSEGRRIVVFGHTHLAKRRELKPGGLYLNSGTWCPTIQLPPDFYSAEQPEKAVLSRLKQFLNDLASNNTEPWCALQTTFVKVTQEGDRSDGELCEFCEDGCIVRIGGSNAG